MNKKILIISIVIGIILVGGIVFSFILFNNGSSTDIKSSTSRNKHNEQRKYSVVYKTEKGAFTTDINPSNFAEATKQIGLLDSRCVVDNNDHNSQICSAFYNGYKDFNYQDSIAALYKNSLLNEFSMVLYFDHNDFNSNKVLEVSNNILNNFFGTAINQKNISTVMYSLKRNMDDEKPMITKAFKVGEFMQQINMQYLKKEQIYVVRYFVSLPLESGINQ